MNSIQRDGLPIVSALYIYPIKSTAGVSLAESELQTLGLAQDRRRALVEAATHRIITARAYPELLKLRTQIADDYLVVSSPQSSVTVPLSLSHQAVTTVNLWAEEHHPGLRYAEDVNRWFSEYLGFDCYLIFMGEGCVRKLPQNVPSGYQGQKDDAVSYADDYPILLASEASVADLNTRLAEPVTMQHFRPNIVLQGCPAYTEDGWRRLRIGECEFEYAQQCPRCVLTTINPETQVKHSSEEPLRTLATYRKTPTGGVPFGVQLVPRRLGKLKVGDRVSYLA